MTTWILIMTFWAGPGAALHSVEFFSEAQCQAVGKAWEAQVAATNSFNTRQAFYICVARRA